MADKKPKKKPQKTPKLDYEKKFFVTLQEWDRFVTEVYGKPYRLQQQDGCKERGTKNFEVRAEDVGKEPDPDCFSVERDYCFEIKSLDSSEEMGVGLDAWLARDPKEPLPDQKRASELELWWARNFYPTLEDIVTDLIARGLLDLGEYVINIDW